MTLLLLAFSQVAIIEKLQVHALFFCNNQQHMKFDIEQLISHCINDIGWWEREHVASAIRRWWSLNDPVTPLLTQLHALEHSKAQATDDAICSKSMLSMEKLKVQHLESKLEQASDDVSDGWGHVRSKCELKHLCGMHVVRAGDIRCECEEQHTDAQQDIAKLQIQINFILKHIQHLIK